MGYFQPGGAGTEIRVYDDADATGGHAAGSPHTWAEINAAFPLDFAILQTAAGATFSASRRQYLCVVDLHIGDPAGGSNFTSVVDTNADIFSPQGTLGLTRLRFTFATSANNTEMRLGTKIGSGQKTDGKDGCNIYATSLLRLRCTLGLYGCYFEASVVQFLNNGSTQQEIAGCKGKASTYLLGDADYGPLTFYNTSLAFTTTLTAVSNALISDSFQLIISGTGPQFFFSSNTPARKLRRLVLNGAVTVADIRMQGAAADWEAADLTWSDTPGLPRILFSGAHTVAHGFTDFRSYDTKVVDHLGNSLQAIPLFLTSDVDGGLVDTQTGFDGNVVFTLPDRVPNTVPVREYYDPTGGGTAGSVVTRDRVYTVLVNGYGGAFPPNPNFSTKKFVYEWAGRDRLGTGYQTNGGSFQKILDVIQLSPGSPSKFSLWDDCEVA